MHTKEFVNKVIVVTGAAHGIGACIAQTFLQLGASVVFADSDELAGRQREQALNKDGGAAQARFIHADLSQAAQVEDFCKKILSEYPQVNLLVNNAGIFSRTDFLRRPLAEWELIINVNLRAAYLCAQFLTQALIGARGNIINIASTRALMSEANTEPYAASKGGIAALTHSMAVTLGKFGIRVNCISPGWIDTAAWQNPPRQSDLRQADHEQHPSGRVGRPEDIAQACLFLASDESAGFITGHNLVVDGGMTRKMIYVE